LLVGGYALAAQGLGIVDAAHLSVRHPITNKRAKTGRPQDVLDVRAMEALRPR
jgi:hypothetical protein